MGIFLDYAKEMTEKLKKMFPKAHYIYVPYMPLQTIKILKDNKDDKEND